MLRTRTFIRFASNISGAKVKSSSALKRPQYDFQFIFNNADELINSAILRRLPTSGVELVRENYNLYKNSRLELNKLQSKRKELEKQLISKKGDGQQISLDQISTIRKQLGSLKNQAKDLLIKHSEYEENLFIGADAVPNVISPDSFVSEPQEIAFLNDNNGKRPLMAENTDHMTVARELGIVDFEAAARVSGSSWYYLIGDGALLEQALVNYAMSKARKKGFVPVIPPSIVRQEMANACGFKPRDQNGEQQIYNLSFKGADLCLTGTAEIPLAGLYSDTELEFDKTGVKKHVGVSRSYRAEAGARGRDTKGLYRVHEFTKVELFAWTDTKERSVTVLDDILELQKEIITELGLTARVLNMSPDELGSPAYKKYDIEAWMPGRRDWGEVTSTSNCLDFQSRRMHTKYRSEDNGNKLAFAQTLNGTAMAVPRVIVAILETFYEPDTKRVKIPEVLRKWMDDKKYITKETMLD
jgi:seryl-tRNA synthetase